MEIGETIGKKSKNAREKRVSKKERGGREREEEKWERRRRATRRKDGEAHFSMHGCNLNAVRTRM